jgi:hypothetical protein
MTIIESIAQAIKKSGKSRYRISKDTQVDQAVLCRIVNGGRCNLETAERLCKYLSLELKPRQRKAR